MTYTTPIVDAVNARAGSAGVLHRGEVPSSSLDNFELQRSPVLVKDASLQRELCDAQGMHRVDLAGAGMSIGSFKVPGWEDFGRAKIILLDAYRPEKLPTSGDWLLVLEAQKK
jgi:hypothetical protein